MNIIYWCSDVQFDGLFSRTECVRVLSPHKRTNHVTVALYRTVLDSTTSCDQNVPVSLKTPRGQEPQGMLFSKFLNLVVDICYDLLDGGSARSKFSYTDKKTNSQPRFHCARSTLEYMYKLKDTPLESVRCRITSVRFWHCPHIYVALCQPATASKVSDQTVSLPTGDNMAHALLCWIPNATNTHSEYLIPIAFPLQQWLHERASVLFACLVRLEIVMDSSLNKHKN